jgi:formate-dependent nitrite reductase membrane component NrfD
VTLLLTYIDWAMFIAFALFLTGGILAFAICIAAMLRTFVFGGGA